MKRCERSVHIATRAAAPVGRLSCHNAVQRSRCAARCLFGANAPQAPRRFVRLSVGAAVSASRRLSAARRLLWPSAASAWKCVQAGDTASSLDRTSAHAQKGTLRGSTPQPRLLKRLRAAGTVPLVQLRDDVHELPTSSTLWRSQAFALGAGNASSASQNNVSGPPSGPTIIRDLYDTPPSTSAQSCLMARKPLRTGP